MSTLLLCANFLSILLKMSSVIGTSSCFAVCSDSVRFPVRCFPLASGLTDLPILSVSVPYPQFYSLSHCVPSDQWRLAPAGGQLNTWRRSYEQECLSPDGGFLSISGLRSVFSCPFPAVGALRSLDPSQIVAFPIEISYESAVRTASAVGMSEELGTMIIESSTAEESGTVRNSRHYWSLDLVPYRGLECGIGDDSGSDRRSFTSASAEPFLISVKSSSAVYSCSPV